MRKNNKFIVTSLILSLGFFAMTMMDSSERFLAIAVLTVATIVMFYWSLREVIGMDATLLSLVLPASFTLGVGLFWFLLPSSLISTLPILVLYAVGIYALIKTSNILVVSTIKTIALGRAAKGAGFVLTLFTSFLLYDAILSLRASILQVCSKF